jgi:hypothetical protein
MASLLDRVVSAHGGLDRWRRLHRLTFRIAIGGALLAVKGRSPRRRSLDVDVDPHRVHAVLRPYPRAGCRGVFEPDRVTIESEAGDVVAERPVVRGPDGRVPRKLVWNDLDLLYFLGYAVWNYAVTPFVFTWPGFECREGSSWREPDGASWQTLYVRYPPGVPTHCRDQVFYFDARGWLCRLDYTADVIGSFARGAHYCTAPREFAGLVVPTRRVVYPRRADRRPVRFVRVMHGRVDGVDVS